MRNVGSQSESHTVSIGRNLSRYVAFHFLSQLQIHYLQVALCDGSAQRSAASRNWNSRRPPTGIDSTLQLGNRLQQNSRPAHVHDSFLCFRPVQKIARELFRIFSQFGLAEAESRWTRRVVARLTCRSASPPASMSSNTNFESITGFARSAAVNIPAKQAFYGIFHAGNRL